MLPYLLIFCRLAIGIMFAYSFLMKVRDVVAFAQSITNFRLLPLRWSKWLARLFLVGELAVVLFENRQMGNGDGKNPAAGENVL